MCVPWPCHRLPWQHALMYSNHLVYLILCLVPSVFKCLPPYFPHMPPTCALALSCIFATIVYCIYLYHFPPFCCIYSQPIPPTCYLPHYVYYLFSVPFCPCLCLHLLHFFIVPSHSTSTHTCPYSLLYHLLHAMPVLLYSSSLPDILPTYLFLPFYVLYYFTLFIFFCLLLLPCILLLPFPAHIAIPALYLCTTCTVPQHVFCLLQYMCIFIFAFVCVCLPAMPPGSCPCY